MPPSPRKPVSVVGLVIGLAGVGVVTATFARFLPVNASTVGFVLLTVVLGVAAVSGFRVSAIVSLAAMLCFNFFFLPPVGRFTIADPENWLALCAFLITALVASHLSDRARKQAAEARRRQQETEQLYALSRAILLTDPSRPIGTQAAQSIAQIFASAAVLIVDANSGQYFRGGVAETGEWESSLDETVRVGNHRRDESLDLDIWPISLGGNPIGALGATGLRMSDGAVQSMLNLVAIALERVRTEEASSRAEAARQSEEFKSTLLDAIAHEFKTPLTSIKAAATGLRTIDRARVADQQELTSIIEEETDRLSQLVTEAVKMAEVDARKVKLNRRPTGIRDLLEMSCDSFQGRGFERIEVAEPIEGTVNVDSDLTSLAVRQVLDNALKYSEAGSTVRCSSVANAQAVELRIADSGAGIPERERDRIFDKFYRRTKTRDHVPGSGLGLHIAREIVRMHGGELWAEAGDPKGSVFCFRFPSEESARR